MPFGMLSRVDPKNHVLDGSTGPPWKWASFRGRACSDMPDDTLTWTVQKWLNRLRCRLGHGLGSAQGSMYYTWPRSRMRLRTEEHAIKNMHGHARRHSAASCAKIAEPIDLPFLLWIRVGRRNHKFNRIRQCAVTGGNIGKTWRIRLNRQSSAAMRPYVKLLWPLIIIMRRMREEEKGGRVPLVPRS